MQLYFTRTYERAIRKLLTAEARREMEASLATAPDAAPIIRGTGGIRKLRRAGSGRGKQGVFARFTSATPAPRPCTC